ncbi:MAG TPA: hypothetical protein VEA78_12300, partial [Acidimicrobiales bacterium]|nr:hypothetical protein [Acidimicrobiales bacterium]
MPVLGTKLHVPSLRRGLVARSRLTDRLRGDAANDARLILVAAPAGFGKTTLLAQWLGRGERAVAWLALDAGDADPHRFLQHLIAAVQVAVPDAGADAGGLLELADAPAEAVLVSLVNDLDAVAGPTVLVLDDYHVIDEPDVHEAVAFLQENLPPQVTLAMTTRVDPPLPLARLRARGELLEVRAADLRFTTDEASAFLNDVMGLSLEPALVDALESRTEGWAAGLQLAALSARDRGDVGEVAAFVADFSGSHRFVLDYLVEEVLDRQPDDVRSFLLHTSIVEELTADLCNALTDRADGQEVLERLERDNVFVVPLDDTRRWFRYHHLFADALRVRLADREPARVRELHATASRWFAAGGLLREAVAHAAASGDQDHTAELVELGVADLRRRRDNRTIREWIGTLPDDLVRRRPLLALYRAWSQLAQGDIDGVEPWLGAAEAGLDPVTTSAVAVPGDAARAREQELRAVPAMIEVYRASVSQARGDVDGTLAHATR